MAKLERRRFLFLQGHNLEFILQCCSSRTQRIILLHRPHPALIGHFLSLSHSQFHIHIIQYGSRCKCSLFCYRRSSSRRGHVQTAFRESFQSGSIRFSCVFPSFHIIFRHYYVLLRPSASFSPHAHHHRVHPRFSSQMLRAVSSRNRAC